MLIGKDRCCEGRPALAERIRLLVNDLRKRFSRGGEGIMNKFHGRVLLVIAAILLGLDIRFDSASSAAEVRDARAILNDSGVQGGLVVHLGCGDGRLTASLHAGDCYLVQGLDTDPDHVAQARDYIRSTGLYGTVSIDRLSGSGCPSPTTS